MLEFSGPQGLSLPNYKRCMRNFTSAAIRSSGVPVQNPACMRKPKIFHESPIGGDFIKNHQFIKKHYERHYIYIYIYIGVLAAQKVSKSDLDDFSTAQRMSKSDLDGFLTAQGGVQKLSR